MLCFIIAYLGWTSKSMSQLSQYIFIFLSHYCVQKCLVWIGPKLEIIQDIPLYILKGWPKCGPWTFLPLKRNISKIILMQNFQKNVWFLSHKHQKWSQKGKNGPKIFCYSEFKIWGRTKETIFKFAPWKKKSGHPCSQLHQHFTCAFFVQKSFLADFF